jgi:futalosine hydrolase
MKLLIVAATEFEIEPFLKQKNNAEILITGVGIPSIVFHLTKKLSEKKYDIVIQAGIGGTFNDNYQLTEVVQIKKDAFADLGIEEKGNFKTLFDMGFIYKNDFPFTDGWLLNSSYFFEKNNLPVAKAITVNKIGDDILQNKIMKEKYSPDVESMEGAAFHYVCLLQKIKFLQIRSISNRVGERNKSEWKLKESIENLNKELFRIIENI